MGAKSFDLWTLADALGMTIKMDGPLISGYSQKEVVIGGLKMPVPVKIVSNAIVTTGPIVLCRSMGNLAFMAATNYKSGAPCSIWLLDLALLDRKLEGLLETLRPKTTQDAVDSLSKAVVRAFDKDPKHLFHLVE